MTGFKKALDAEIKKTAGRKKVKVAMVLCLIATLISAVICTLAGNFMGVNMTGKAEFSLTVLPVFLNFLIPLFVIFMCIDVFGAEFSSGTMKTTLLTGAPRYEIFFAKTALLGIFIAAMLAFSMVTSFIASIIIGKTEWAILRVIFSYIISFFPLMTFAFMCARVSNVIKSSGASFMISVLLYIAFYVLGIVFPALSAFFFTSGFDVYILLSRPSLGAFKIIRTLLMLLGYSALFAGLGEYLFEKKEF